MFVSVHTYKETAKALQLSEDVVRKTEIRALAKLRRNKQLREAAREAGLLSEQMENAS
jgi:DNA-directed RNA polymerase specialized sigma24 family protein